jgi:20S proteasome alpha/beta subunit
MPLPFLVRRHPLINDRIPRGSRIYTPKRKGTGNQRVTVCIAARAGSFIFGASDRMLTSGDVQFEPSAGTKIYLLSNSIFMMTAGDAALQAEIVGMVSRAIAERIIKEPTNWWKVSEAADLYVKYYNVIRNKRAEDAILSPLQMDGPAFIANHRMLSDQLANDLARELLNFEMPNVAAIFAGIDPDGPHIYVIRDNQSNCVDNVGFAAIGIGGRHASSQFMFARHAWNSPLPETLFLTYYAKKKAEVAPGVGKGTDMVMVGPTLTTLTALGGHVLEKLENEYQKVIIAENNAFSEARGEMAKYVEELNRQAEATATIAADTQTAPGTADGKAPSEGSAVREPSEAEATNKPRPDGEKGH